MVHGAFENEIEEQGVVIIDFIDRAALVGGDEAVARERSSPDQRIDRRQRVVAAVDQAGMVILSLKNRREGHRQAIELEHRRDFTEKHSYIFALVHEAQEEIKAFQFLLVAIIQIITSAQAGSVR